VGNPRIDLDEPVGTFEPKDISTSFFAAVITGRLRDAMETGARAARHHQLSGVFAPQGIQHGRPKPPFQCSERETLAIYSTSALLSCVDPVRILPGLIPSCRCIGRVSWDPPGGATEIWRTR
jgi:hypothetical protein